MKTTKAPWQYLKLGDEHWILDDDNDAVCTVFEKYHTNLIAAAPELLDALIYAVDANTPGRTDGPAYMHADRWMRMAQAAIAKATGGEE